MEHEVFVPVPAEALRQTLRDPLRVARCVPGFQQDADESASPLSGRLKVRAGGHTITYGGSATLSERKAAFTIEGDGTEVRGKGEAKVTLTLRLKKVRNGTTLTFTGTSQAEGRLAELSPETTLATAHRLLDRFAARLAEESTTTDTASGADGTSAEGTPTEDTSAEDTSAHGASEAPDEVTAASGDVAEAEPVGDPAAPLDSAEADLGDADLTDDDLVDGPADSAPDSVFDVPVPPSSPEGETTSAEGDFLVPDESDDSAAGSDEPPAEAAHARRTMIGRSAEEVDHAPPRGRYAPVPPPEAAGARATLRWVAPAAALALASAVVVGRVLRRRK